MAFDLKYINERIRADAAGFVEACEADYAEKVQRAAVAIAENRTRSPIVLLSGPSGSGKTTTAKRISDVLETLGVRAHTVAMDEYYMASREDGPHTPNGEPDFESPERLDLALIDSHFDDLENGQEIQIPHFSFSLQRRVEPKHPPMSLGKDEIAIFEGIHALNSRITERHPTAFKLYISARSDTMLDGKVVFKGTWTRLVRRTIRDDLFRGANAAVTLGMWANVRRGEKAYISPFKDQADLQFDTALPYEISAMREYAKTAFKKAPEGAERRDEFEKLTEILDLYELLDCNLVPPKALIREFIGGGTYKY